MSYATIFENMVKEAVSLNERNITDFLDYNPDAKALDLGCDNGIWSSSIAEIIGSDNIYGVDICKKGLFHAKGNIKNVIRSDFDEGLPFKDETFDVIHANQVIEHISNLDVFISEIYRVLKRGGYTIISTENASSWANIFSIIMGWQMFSLTNVSMKGSVGNPLSLHRGEETDHELGSWTHKVIFSYLGLKEIFQKYGFKRIEMKGSGYYPFPASFGKMDVRHAHFITLRGHK